MEDVFRMRSASAARAVRSTATYKHCSGRERSLGHPRSLPPAFLQSLKEYFSVDPNKYGSEIYRSTF